MQITSTIRKPAAARPTESVLIVAEDEVNAVWVPKSEFENYVDDPAVKAVQQQVIGALTSALGPQLGMPVKLIATGMKNQKLYERAVAGNLNTGDGARMIGVACSASSALSAALGYPTAAGALKLSSKALFLVAQTQEEYVTMVGESNPQTDTFFEQTADAVSAE